MKQQIVPVGAGAEYNWSSDRILVKASADMVEGRVTVVEDTLKPGFQLARHHHRTMTEVFYILDGEVEFAFDDETVVVGAGATLTIPPRVWHEVSCREGAAMLTVFSPGGFEDYLAELAALGPERSDDESLMTALAEKYDTWMR